MKIKLIAPHDQSGAAVSSADTFPIRKVNLPLLAALTPPGHDVAIVDEAFAPDNPDEAVDLVGITVMTDLARRAYTIADDYRSRGVPVAMGGVHPSVLPGEALQHADAVVTGEADTTWPALVSDAAAGRLQRLYRAAAPACLAGMPVPKRDLYPRHHSRSYTPVATGIETSRGCPYDCEFCSVSAVMGSQYRVRPAEEVLAEAAACPDEHLFFVDDSLAINRRAARTLFEGMIPLGRKWAGEGPVTLAEDVGLLRLMRRAGCAGLLIGFESVQKQASDDMRKLKNLRIDFAEAVRRFHGEGLAILGAFVFGFDHETADVFDQTLEFAMKVRLDCLQLRILTPFPGTRLYARLLEEGRLFAPAWWLNGYPPDTLLYQPKGMSANKLVDGFARLNRQVYTYRSIAKRFFGVNPLRRGSFGCSVYAGLNLATRGRYLKSIRTPQPFVDRPGQELGPTLTYVDEAE